MMRNSQASRSPIGCIIFLILIERRTKLFLTNIVAVIIAAYTGAQDDK